MDITGSELITEYEKASANWPFIHQTELAHGLPRMLLFAVGSRETNLTNEVGDFGHGHGVWQLDNRSHNPAGGWAHFDADVTLQCAMAAEMLQGFLRVTGGDVTKAADIYNSGQEGLWGTTGHDYGSDVLERMQYLQAHAGTSGPNVVGAQSAPAWFHRDLGLASPYMTGADVRVVQTKTGAAADGAFGPVTRVHVVNFQSHHGLTADGVVGAQTAKVLGS
jgi:peptidoglycan hydrolase-like protein with peptidoglycan-binding domain